MAAGSDLRAILGTFLKCIVIVTLIAGYPDIMRGGQSAFIELRNKFTSARDAKFVQLLHSTVQNQPSDSITEIEKIVPAAIGNFFQGYRAVYAVRAPVLSGIRHRWAHCRLTAPHRFSLLFLYAIRKRSLRRHLADCPPLACGHLPG
jgi:hypothetical protein